MNSPDELQPGRVTLMYAEAGQKPLNLPQGVAFLPPVFPKPSSEPALLLDKNDFPSGGLDRLRKTPLRGPRRSFMRP